MRTNTLHQATLTALLSASLALSASAAESVDTRMGKIEVESGYPSGPSLNKLVDELDYQRACQSYIWGLPIVGLNEWKKAHDNIFKVRNGQFVAYLTFDQKLGILTPNFDTPYCAALADLGKSGPLVIEIPKGATAGMIMDAWQRSLSDLGLVGPDRGHRCRPVGPPDRGDDVRPAVLVEVPERQPPIPASTLSSTAGPDGRIPVHPPLRVRLGPRAGHERQVRPRDRDRARCGCLR